MPERAPYLMAGSQRARYGHLLEDKDVRRWYENVSRGSEGVSMGGGGRAGHPDLRGARLGSEKVQGELRSGPDPLHSTGKRIKLEVIKRSHS
jgi:hypothetical protein